MNELKRFAYVALFLLIIIAGFISYLLLQPEKAVHQLSYNHINDSEDKKTAVQFTHPIFDPNTAKNITPLGELNGGYIEAQTINGVMVNLDKEHTQMEVFAPTDMTLTEYSYYTWNDSSPAWSLGFSMSPDVSMTLHHINWVSPKIKDVVTGPPKKNDSSSEYPREEIFFEAGELIATAPDPSTGNNWNIYVYDKNQTNSFVNQKRYEESMNGDVYLNAVCPFAYYKEPLKSKYLSLMGYYQAGNSENCGTNSRDVKGSLSGMWHTRKKGILSETDGTYSSPLSIYKNSANQVIIYEINNAEYRIDTNNPTFKDPSTITSSHCYLLNDNWDNSIKGYAYFQILSDLEMRVAYGSSKQCPDSFPVNNSKRYYR